MSTLSLILVVTAAVLHALWNLLTKQVKGGLIFFWLVSLFSAIIFLPFLLNELLRAPVQLSQVALTMALGSGLLHIFYFVALQAGYRKGDLSVVYPVARGAGPVFAVTGAVLLFGERPGIGAVTGFVLIIGGVCALTGFKAGEEGKPVRQGVYFGLLTGLFIAAYTLWDKAAVADYGVSAIIIAFASMILPLLLLIPVVMDKMHSIRTEIQLHWKQVLGVAILQPLSYLLVLIAMKTTPLTYVAPVRELSIVFGVFFGVNLLKEKDSIKRLLAAVVILAGIVLLALN
ncbi:DMT family transporter [Chitinophaga sp. GCM10012297]|uniref:EamA family transporter n=1 Tax=Chitinophaga chungangae TaxID=2821488 RepID=A0ABS3YAB0_9BACT|nr:DMT family transporter [Chitinophaga chungangae]MBO9151620.1 EamA family transporter [Chitinophaga chungangae]